MYISWFGQSCFKIQGSRVTVVTDPFDPTIGLKLSKLKADIVTISHDHYDHNNIQIVKGIGSEKPFIINSPGEYEIKNTLIFGISSWHDNQKGIKRGINTIYRIKMDDLIIAHLGDLGHVLTDEQLNYLKEIDILMIPVGEVYTIGAKEACQIISQLEPRLVIPMHYKIKGLKINLESVDKFCKEIGICIRKPINKLKIKKIDLSPEEMKIIVLSP